MSESGNKVGQMINDLMEKPVFLILGALLTAILGYCIQTQAFYDTYRSHATGALLHAPAPMTFKGQEVYLNSGCQYCHSQNIRALPWEIARFSDKTKYGYFALNDPMEARFSAPSVHGSFRIGPDISHLYPRYTASALKFLLQGKSGSKLARASHQYGSLFNEDSVYSTADGVFFSWKIRTLMNAGMPLSDSLQFQAMQELPGKTRGEVLTEYLLSLGRRQAEYAGKYYTR